MAAINVDKLSLKEPVALETKLRSAIAEARGRERSDIKKKIANLAQSHGFSLGDLFDGKNVAKKPINVPKYANPENKSDTWTGLGCKPNWLVLRLKKGAELADFEI